MPPPKYALIDNPFQQIVNVNWGGYWLHIHAVNSAISGDMGVVIRKRGAKILATSSYQQDGGGGTVTTTYYVWMPVNYSLNFGLDFEGVLKARFISENIFVFGDHASRDFHAPVGYLTLDDALAGIKAPGTDDKFNYLNAGSPWIVPDALAYGTPEEAAAKKAEISLLLTQPKTPAIFAANLWSANRDWQVSFPPIADPAAIVASDPGAFFQNYVVTSKETTTDPVGFGVFNALVETPLSSSDDEIVFDIVLQGGIDSFDDPSWILSVDVYTKLSGTRGDDGKLKKHTIVPSVNGSFLIDPADDPLWSMNVDTLDGNQFGLAAGAYSLVLRKRPWKVADPTGAGSKDVDGNPIPGKIIECWPRDTHWAVFLIALTAEDSHNSVSQSADFLAFDRVGPPPLST